MTNKPVKIPGNDHPISIAPQLAAWWSRQAAASLPTADVR